eukprot:GILJ01005618.1.p1 GENE.GILJ01005618.1~~GILJ01005618.1.p1  ORF type:complete len:996 (-),score=124.65 GILJ01005618.1:18-3005(-)
MRPSSDRLDRFLTSRHHASSSFLWTGSNSTRPSSGGFLLPSLQLYLKQFVFRIKDTPIILFYRYLWKQNKPLLGTTLFVNYFLPMILEAGPWYLSRRKLAAQLRDVRNRIQHRMTGNRDMNTSLLVLYVGLTFGYALLQTIDVHLRSRIAVGNKFVIKRMVLERLLHSEIGALEVVREKAALLPGNAAGDRDLESRIFSDISQTLQLFNFTLPSILNGFYTLVKDGLELYQNRNEVDALAVLRPFITVFLSHIFEWLRDLKFERRKELTIRKTNWEMSRLMTNVVGGLHEIQINNLQQQQLRLLDRLIGEEMSTSQGFGTLLTRSYNAISNRSVFDFVGEVVVVHKVMKRRGLDHESYRRVQNDVDHVVRLSRRLLSLIVSAVRVIVNQTYVTELLNVPNFLSEEKLPVPKPLKPFRTLILRDIKFSFGDLTCPNPSPAVLDLCGKEIQFVRGKTYGIIGQNRAGKSTLVQLICKLYNLRQDRGHTGEITVNGLDYNTVPRKALRSMISYVSQRPFLFPGTVRENILVGNPQATPQMVYEAAARAGLFLNTNSLLNQESGSNGRASQGASSVNADLMNQTTREVTGRLPFSSPALHTVPCSQIASAERRWSHMFRVLDLPLLRDPTLTAEPVPIQTSYSATQPSSRSSSFSSGVDSWNRNAWFDQLRQYTLSQTPVAKRFDGRRHSDQHLKYATAQHYADLSIQPKTLEEQQADAIRWSHPLLDQEVQLRGSNISGGFAQSISLARIFIRTSAEIVILDEAMGQMDAVKKRDVILPHLFTFIRQHHMTLLLISHDLRDLADVHHIMVLENGRLACEGSHYDLTQATDGSNKAYLKLLGQTDETVTDAPESEILPQEMVSLLLSPAPEEDEDEAEGSAQQADDKHSSKTDTDANTAVLTGVQRIASLHKIASLHRISSMIFVEDVFNDESSADSSTALEEQDEEEDDETKLAASLGFVAEITTKSSKSKKKTKKTNKTNKTTKDKTLKKKDKNHSK